MKDETEKRAIELRKEQAGNKAWSNVPEIEKEIWRSRARRELRKENDK